ncbi:MAG: class I SAM-dependent methyltransferase [Pseudomonadota bacterium]|nr:class I SAM-dependent methyltransferase [Pseudomonadota bacterium]
MSKKRSAGGRLPTVAVMATHPAASGRAGQLARRLGVPMGLSPLQGDARFVIEVDQQGLAFCDRSNSRLKALRPRDLPMHRTISRGGLLARALGKQGHYVVDTTAGFGNDTLHIAALGFKVTAIERSPVVCALLKDRLSAIDSDDISGLVDVQGGDARQVLPKLTIPDVIYMDPMFPLRSNSSAKPNKAQQLLRALLGDEDDAGEVFELAYSLARYRVVVKRPRHAPPLAGQSGHQVLGRAVRYDVYFAGR